MFPVLGRFALGGATFVVPAYGTFLTLAAIVALALAVRGAGRLGVSRGAAIAGFGLAVVAGLVGARAMDVVLNWDAYSAEPGHIVAPEFRGFTLYGGFPVAIAVAAVAARRWRVPLAALADSAVPAVAAGLVLLRIGCFLNGCCVGTATDLPWGVAFPFGSTAWGEQVLGGRISIFGLVRESDPVHPTQLYELVAVVGCAALALWLRRRGAASGIAALGFAAGYALARAAIQVVREPLPTATAPDWLLPLVYLAAAAVIAVMLMAQVRRPASAPSLRLAAH